MNSNGTCLNKNDIKVKISTYYQTNRDYFDKLDRVFADRGKEAYQRGSFDILSYAKSATCILDIGCGSGALLFFLRGVYPEKQYYGIDVSPLAIEKASQKNAGNMSPVTFLVADIEKDVPFEKEMFDLVIAHEVIEHFVDPEKAIFNIAETLKPGGFFFLLAPNRLVRSSLHIVIKKMFDYARMVFDKEYINPTIVDPSLDIIGGDSDAVYVANPWELHRMARLAGFDMVKKSHLKCRFLARKL